MAREREREREEDKGENEVCFPREEFFFLVSSFFARGRLVFSPFPLSLFFLSSSSKREKNERIGKKGGMLDAAHF